MWQGDLPHPIHVDESTWTLTSVPSPDKDGGPVKQIEVHLDKSNKLQWWEHVVTSAPKIDVTKIQPENSKLGMLVCLSASDSESQDSMDGTRHMLILRRRPRWRDPRHGREDDVRSATKGARKANVR
jgi:hypothetical protein